MRKIFTNKKTKTKNTNQEQQLLFKSAKNCQELQQNWFLRTKPQVEKEKKSFLYFKFSLLFLEGYRDWKPYNNEFKEKYFGKENRKSIKNSKKIKNTIHEENEIPKLLTIETIHFLNHFFKFLSEYVYPTFLQIQKNPNSNINIFDNINNNLQFTQTDITENIQNGISLQIASILARSSIHRKILYNKNAHLIISKLLKISLKFFTLSIEFIHSNPDFSDLFHLSIFLLSHILKIIFLFEKYETQKNSKYKNWINEKMIYRLTKNLLLLQENSQQFLLTYNAYQLEIRILTLIKLFILNKYLSTKTKEKLVNYCIRSVRIPNIYAPLLTSFFDKSKNGRNDFLDSFKILINFIQPKDKIHLEINDNENNENNENNNEMNILNILIFKIKIHVFTIMKMLVFQNPVFLQDIISEPNFFDITDLIFWTFYSFVGEMLVDKLDENTNKENLNDDNSNNEKEKTTFDDDSFQSLNEKYTIEFDLQNYKPIPTQTHPFIKQLFASLFKLFKLVLLIEKKQSNPSFESVKFTFLNQMVSIFENLFIGSYHETLQIISQSRKIILQINPMIQFEYLHLLKKLVEEDLINIELQMRFCKIFFTKYFYYELNDELFQNQRQIPQSFRNLKIELFHTIFLLIEKNKTSYDPIMSFLIHLLSSKENNLTIYYDIFQVLIQIINYKDKAKNKC
ncbi:hypothetical protein M0811_03196 [Anaeramoeba ignava]|uniref:Uncharacterized protein n=1 Tax=Anaeramoeba ignava TaxID=1746090 RepID=A0A9Q0R4D5_ANAIG|nr:hypothetical protein M0811_03196 [Anaeramoeba ignava]